MLYVSVQTAEAALGVNDYVFVRQPIEGYRTSRLAWGSNNAQPITIGFWSGHHRTGVYSGVVRNSANNRSYAFSYTHNTADTPQYNVVTIPGDVTGTWNIDNTVGLYVIFAVAAGTTPTAPSANSWVAGNYVAAPGQVNAVAATSDVFRITGVVVLPGIEAPSAARSPFIMRPYDQELVTCRRYLQIITGQGLTGTPNTTTALLLAAQFAMRATPTLTLLKTSYSAGSFELFIGGGWVTNAAAALTGVQGSINSVIFNMTGFSGLVAGQTAFFNTLANIILADARL
jgi:hypothetical protein